jgi:MFS family permease
MYILSYIDRTNIAMAIPAMRSELGISASAIGFATGTFFWGYLILQIPAGRLAAVWSAKWVIFGLLMFWSIVSCSTAFVHTENEQDEAEREGHSSAYSALARGTWPGRNTSFCEPSAVTI